MTDSPRIAVIHYADVRNFGDVLFPLVMKRELQARIPNADIHFVNASGSSWAGIESARFDEVNFDEFDAILLGGGQVIHRYDDVLRGIYERFGLSSIERPTDLVFGWSHSKAPFKAWLGLGLAEPPDQLKAEIAETAKGLTYIGVRGSQSGERLRQSGAANVKVSPDLGWLFPRLLADRPRPPHPADGAPYIAVQALGMQDATALVSSLRNASRSTGLRVVLLPLTRCWNDCLPLRVLKEASGGEFILVDDMMPDLDKLAILGGATMYIGQSMHGMIGALCQARPAGICLPDGNDKFTELLADANFLQFRSDGWGGIERLAQTLVWSPLGLITQHRKNAEIEVDALFDDVTAQLMSAVSAR